MSCQVMLLLRGGKGDVNKGRELIGSDMNRGLVLMRGGT